MRRSGGRSAVPASPGLQWHLRRPQPVLIFQVRQTHAIRKGKVGRQSSRFRQTPQRRNAGSGSQQRGGRQMLGGRRPGGCKRDAFAARPGAPARRASGGGKAHHRQCCEPNCHHPLRHCSGLFCSASWPCPPPRWAPGVLGCVPSSPTALARRQRVGRQTSTLSSLQRHAPELVWV